ncbi:MAG: TIGR04282 family arsenosugar biosynthesis glycosyltransferase [Saprospiraceae bacterium]
MEQALIIFVKNLVSGKVKTRLAKDAGDATALEIYKNLMDHTRLVVSHIDATRLLFYSDRVERLDSWPEKKYSKNLQTGDDLGERMFNAFKQATDYDKKIIIGSDCPGITPTLIEEAFTALDYHDVVIGPAVDGGYYLIGMNTLIPEVLQNIPWSTDQVLLETIKILQQKRLLYKLLTPLRDVDSLEDWQAEKGKLLREQTI